MTIIPSESNFTNFWKITLLAQTFKNYKNAQIISKNFQIIPQGIFHHYRSKTTRITLKQIQNPEKIKKLKTEKF